MINNERRSFLVWATNGLGAIFAAILGIPAICYLIDPRNRASASTGEARPVENLRLGDLRPGQIVQGLIRDRRRDAWTRHDNDVVGRVWIVKTGAGPEELQVFTTVCPHLGCSINDSAGAGGCAFKCPCHGAEYLQSGARVERPGYNNPAPRGMDSLAWHTVADPANPDPNNRDRLMVVYQNFVAGSDEKIVKP